jgi:epoxyqueuosine reductase
VLSSSDIKQRAREIGFDACGIAPATDLPELAALATWLERGYAGEMVYMHKSAATRADVRCFLPGARSVVMTASL